MNFILEQLLGHLIQYLIGEGLALILLGFGIAFWFLRGGWMELRLPK